MQKHLKGNSQNLIYPRLTLRGNFVNRILYLKLRLKLAARCHLIKALLMKININQLLNASEKLVLIKLFHYVHRPNLGSSFSMDSTS